MIQEIAPHLYDNTYYTTIEIKDNDYVLIFKNDSVYMLNDYTSKYIPKYKELKNRCDFSHIKLIYLFKIDNTGFFMAKDFPTDKYDFFYRENISIFRTLKPKQTAFGGVTAKHLYDWYSKNKFCGKCGHELKVYDKERAMHCAKCSNIIYPSIAPAIIVGIINKDKILLTKYAGRDYKKYALVAGFVEVGESIEDTVKREAMEEVGLKVKNIRYFASQPWGFTNTVLMGYFADVDGNDKIILEQDELSEASWFRYDELPPRDLLISLTQTMIDKFEKEKGNV